MDLPQDLHAVTAFLQCHPPLLGTCASAVAQKSALIVLSAAVLTRIRCQERQHWMCRASADRIFPADRLGDHVAFIEFKWCMHALKCTWMR